MENLNNQKICCFSGNKKGFLSGLFYGILPHTFCIAFIVFSIIGASTATLFFRRFLFNSYFFYILIGISFIFATISAIFYLKRNGILSFQGVKRKWRYFLILYGTTIFVNLLFFWVIFPIFTNLNLNKIQDKNAAAASESISLPSITLGVSIPCSGHAPLITEELLKLEGIKDVKFKLPNLFEIKYNPLKTSKEKIISLEIFKEFKATIIE